MNEPVHDDAGQQPAYRIGAAARLTGLSTHTLRKWQDRYALVAPRRSAGGERLYSAVDVKRLALIKELARGGMTLSELAPLAVEELEQLLRQGRERAAPAHVPQARASVAAAVVGAALPLLLARDAARLRQVRVIAHGESTEQAVAMLGEAVPDVLLFECPAVSAATEAQIEHAMHTLHAGAAIVIYGFAASADLDALRRPELALLRAPVDALELERSCLGLMASLCQHGDRHAAEQRTADEAPVPVRRLSSQQLAQVAGTASTISCECPRHLADLILGLDAFEQYSARCESRDDKDAALHRHLRITAATSRALFEDALERVAAHEGIAWPPTLAR